MRKLSPALLLALPILVAASLADARDRNGLIYAPDRDPARPIGAPDFAPNTRPVLVQPLPAGGSLGGGFIEFLFGGGGSGTALMPRQPHQRPWQEMSPDRGEQPGRPLFARRDDPEVRDEPQRRGFDPRFERQVVDYDGPEKPGTVVVDTEARFLYLVQEDTKAIRYGIGVGRPGFEWAGVKQVSQKREWPDWIPPAEMLKRRPDLPTFMAGGPENPLGARAIYLGSSLYRIHGSNEPHTIGQAVSSGCIRMRNEDVIDLYNRVKVGTRVVVL